MEKKSVKELRDLVLENKTIKIKPIIRRKSYLKAGHDGEHTYTGCYKTYGLPYDSQKRSYTDPFKSVEEQEAFEVLLKQKEGSLNLYEFKVGEPNFWGDFTIRIPKEGIDLNLMNPADALMYRIICVNPKFAKTEDEGKVVEKEYIIVNDQEVKDRENSLGLKRDKANDHMHKIKKSKREMVDMLKLLGKKASVDWDADTLKTELYKIIDTVATTPGTIGLDKFIEVMNDVNAEVKLFVLNAIDSKEITRDTNGYKITDSSVSVGRNYSEVVNYFNSKDPAVQEQRLIIEERLKN